MPKLSLLSTIHRNEQHEQQLNRNTHAGSASGLNALLYAISPILVQITENLSAQKEGSNGKAESMSPDC